MRKYSLAVVIQLLSELRKDSNSVAEAVIMHFERELLKGSTDAMLLCLINSKPMYGYQIIKEFEKKSNGYFQFKGGTLYPALHRLEKTGLVKANWEKQPGSQKRRYYYITERGQEALSEKMVIWRGFSRAVDLIMLPAA